MNSKSSLSTNYRAVVEAFKMLEQDGFLALRSARPHGLFDLVGISSEIVKLIQLKIVSFGEKSLFSEDRETIKNLAVPPFVKKELWIYEKHRGWHYYLC